MLPLQKKEKDSFILKLNKELYSKDILDKAIAEDKGFAERITSQGKYVFLRLKTTQVKEAFEWINYLLYLHKTSI